MPNSIKYSTTGDTLSLKKGNFFIGTGDVGKGPTSATTYWNGISPPSGGYSVYKNKVSNGPAIWTAASDNQLVSLTNNIEGTSFTTAQQCINYFATQSDKMVLNKDYERIVTDGLVLNVDAGFLPSYQGSGTTWYDLAYSGNNGTLTNGPTYSSLDGGTISFDGINDYVNFGNTPSLTITGNSVTLESWINYNLSQQDWKGIIYKADGNSSGYQLFIDSSERVSVGIVTSNGLVRPNAGFILPADTWHHIVGSYDGTNIRIYVNGILYNTTPQSGNILTSTRNLYVGMSFASEEFPGYISSARIYNRCLSSTEVLQNYNASISRFNTSNMVKSGLVLNLDSSNTVSYPTSGTTWLDLSGNGNKGTLTNGPTFDSTSKSIVFDGIDDFMQANISSKDLDGDPSFTVDMVVKRNLGTNIGPNYGFWGIGGTGQGNSVQGWTPTQNLIHLDVYDSTRLATSEYYPENQYIHLVWTKNGPGQETTNVKCYVNGVEKSLTKTRNATRTNQFNTSTNGVGVCLGRINGDSSNFQSPVTVSSFRVYNNALSQTEVLQNYYQAPIVTSGLVMALDAGNLVSYSGAGTTWKDLTTNGYNGTLTNGPTFSSLNEGYIVFDGSDDWVQIPTYTFGNGNWSVNVWVNADSLSNFNLISNSSGGPVTNAFGFDSNKIFYRNYNGNWQGNVGNTILSTNTWYMLTWVNYAGASESLGTMQMFVNGISDSSTFNSYTTNGGPCNAIGRNWFSNFSGEIGNVQFYNKSLTLSEVAQNYNAYKSRFGL